MTVVMPAVFGVETFIVSGDDNKLLNRLIRVMHQPTDMTMQELKYPYFVISDFYQPDIRLLYFDGKRYEVIAKEATIEDIIARANDADLDIEFDNCFVVYKLDKTWTLYSKDLRYKTIVNMVIDDYFLKISK